MTENKLTLPAAITNIAKQLDGTVLSVIGAENIAGFEKAYLVAMATGELKKALTKEYMKPIMELQGSKLGFKTDRDDKGGYAEEVVKNCLIEAVLSGLQPIGNQFNIISSNMYPTKEGLGALLAKYPGLIYETIPGLPRINADKSGAAVLMKISWCLNGGEKKERELDIPVKMNNFMGTDAVLGKATRKARAWLYGTLVGVEVGDGDASEVRAEVSDVKEGNKEVAESGLNALKEAAQEKLL